MKDYKNMQDVDFPCSEVQDEGMNYGSVDAIRLQGINTLWATEDKSVLSAMVQTMKDLLLKYQPVSLKKRITHEDYASQFSSEAIATNLHDFEAQFKAGKPCGIELDDYVANLQKEFPWLTD